MNMILLSSVQRILNASATGARCSHNIGAGHLYRRCSCPLLAGLSSRDHHGALRSGGRVDRGFGPDYRVDRGGGARIRRCALVALAREAQGRPARRILISGFGHQTDFMAAAGDVRFSGQADLIRQRQKVRV